MGILRKRAFWLGLLILVIGGFSGRAVWRSYANLRASAVAVVRDKPQHLIQCRDEYQRIAEFALPKAQLLSRQFLQYAASGDRLQVRAMFQTCEELRVWIAQHQPAAPQFKVRHLHLDPADITLDVGVTYGKLDRAVVDFMDAVRQSSLIEPAAERQVATQRAADASSRITELAQYAQSRKTQLDDYLSLFDNWSPLFRKLLLACVILLAVLTFCLTILVYRLRVAPLQAKLSQSTAIIAQQREAAQFGELAASLAHEVRNPLTSISVRLYSLTKSIPPQSPEAEDASVITAEISRLDLIVRDFLDLARPAEPRMAAVSADDLFQYIHTLMNGELTQHGITLALAPGKAPPFQADPEQIKQVLINLVRNAAEAIQRNGTISLSAQPGRRQLRQKERAAVVLQVTDTGPGIPADVQAKLFEPFFSTKDNGSGLGLPISQRIVERHGGELRFDTTEGRGTTFSVTLPVETARG